MLSPLEQIIKDNCAIFSSNKFPNTFWEENENGYEEAWIAETWFEICLDKENEDMYLDFELIFSLSYSKETGIVPELKLSSESGPSEIMTISDETSMMIELKKIGGPRGLEKETIANASGNLKEITEVIKLLPASRTL
jgi:hypothetical protein